MTTEPEMVDRSGAADLRPFQELGVRLERDWLAAAEELAAFPALAAEALERAALPRRVDPTAVLRASLSPVGFPRQADVVARFGQPPITLHAGRRFHLSALFWVDGTTSIHQHSFSGAFQVLAGGSLQTRYTFTPEIALGVYRTGRLQPLALERVRVGDVWRIEPGETGLIHSLFHLERPSVTLVIRTWRDQRAEPQYNYHRPGIGTDPFLEDDWSTRMQQIVHLLATVGDPASEELIGRMIDAGDPRTAFLVLERALELDDRRAFDRLVQRAQERIGPAARALPECFEELRRVRLIARRRAQVRQPDHRYFLALMMNAPDRTRALEGVAAFAPGAPPAQTAARWIAELAKVTVPLQVAGVPWEPSVLALPEVSDPAQAALRACLEGGPPPARAEDAAFIETVSRSPFLRPLFR
jgi:hypothetical protein